MGLNVSSTSVRSSRPSRFAVVVGERRFQALKLLEDRGELPEDFTVPVEVRFSNRPFGVKRFQTIHLDSVDVAHGLALLFGIGTKALPAWDPRMRWNNL